MKTSYSDKGFLSAIYEGKSHQDLHTCLFVSFLSQEEPKRISQALRDPAWVEAMQEELLQFKLQKVWILVDLPKVYRAIGTKWVYRNKKDERGIVIRNKARLIAQGHTQEEGIYYDEVFVLVARIEAIRILLAYASYMGFMVYQIDVKSAFLYGQIEEEVYVCQPPGFEDPDHPNNVYKVVKALQSLLLNYFPCLFQKHLQSLLPLMSHLDSKALVSLDLSRLATTLKRLERSNQIGINKDANGAHGCSRTGCMGLYTAKEIELVGFGAYMAESARQIPDKGDLSAYWIGISSAIDFLGIAPSYTSIKDPMLRLCHRLITCSIAGRSQAPMKVIMTHLFYLRGMDVGSVNIPYLLARYFRLFASGRKQGAMILGGQFVGHLAKHFGLLTKERLQGLTVIVQDLPEIDTSKLVVTAGTAEAAEDAPVVDEAAPAVLAPTQAP
ncbi:putative ribonuclease H-like domain-containing protein [Tanacetum coccineum]